MTETADPGGNKMTQVQACGVTLIFMTLGAFALALLLGRVTTPVMGGIVALGFIGVAIFWWGPNRTLELSKDSIKIRETVRQADEGLERIKTVEDEVKRTKRDIDRLYDDGKIAKAEIDKLHDASKINAQQLKDMDTIVKQANTAIFDAQLRIKFIDTFVAAQSDDRKGLEQLLVWGEDKNFPMSAEAMKAFKSILDANPQSPYFGGYFVHWSPTVDPSTLSIAQIREAFLQVPKDSEGQRIGMLEFVKSRKDLSKVDRMQFYIDVLRETPSVKVAAFAGRFFNEDSNDNLLPLAIREHLQWWEQHKAEIK